MTPSRFVYWIPSIIWMVCIYVFSSQQGLSITGASVTDFIVNKSLHLVEYSTLFILNTWALVKGRKAPHNSLAYAFILTLSYAVFDEFHQTFVPTRSGVPQDVIIDTVGMLIGGLMVQSKGIRKYFKPRSV